MRIVQQNIMKKAYREFTKLYMWMNGCMKTGITMENMKNNVAKYESRSFIAPVTAESSARDIGGDTLYFSALCLDERKKETRQGRKNWILKLLAFSVLFNPRIEESFSSPYELPLCKSTFCSIPGEHKILSKKISSFKQINLWVSK